MKKRTFALALALAVAVATAFVPGMVPAFADDTDIQSQSLGPGDSVWLNGKTGDDANEGTEDAPVKTFARAKELMDEVGSDTIWITGTVTIDGTSESWDLGGKTVMRDGEFTGELVHVQNGGSLTLTNIIVDGGLANGAYAKAKDGDGGGGSLVGVYKQSTLTIGEGAKLQNNRIISTGSNMPDSGGGVFACNGTVNVEGGTVSGNTAVYGGGIAAVYDSTVNMSSGTIAGNTAVSGSATFYDKGYGGTGGGVIVWRGAKMNFYGGTIANNDAYERGGGISVGGYMTFTGDTSSTLTMTGGTVTGNTAGSAGGGIFVQSGLSADANYGEPTYSVATITAGAISGNAMTGKGNSNKSFGGGGIYVNGYSSKYSSYHNGELYLTKVEVSGNAASIAGGGYAGCPVSVTDVLLTNGSVFYGNSTDGGNARDIYVLASTAYGAHSGDPAYRVSPSMLGGCAYRWVYDDGTEVPLDKLSGTLKALQQEQLSLSNALDASDAGVKKALGMAQVHITGNTSATRGGGIGTNGTVHIGKEVDTIDVVATKLWQDADDVDGIRPESVTFELYRDGTYVGYQTVKANDDGEWKTTFSDLPKEDENGTAYTYTVKERDVEGYASEVTGNATDGFTVTNTRTTTSVDVTKKWDDNDDADGTRPKSVTVNLLRDGQKVDSAKIAADEDGNWSHTFSGLAKYDEGDGHEYAYTVEEVAVDGYSSEVTGDAASGFTITNTKTSTPPSDDNPPSDETKKKTEKTSVTPQTGEGSNPWAALAVVGALAAGVGAVACRRVRSN